jgi:HEPN domain-containing protein
LRNSSTTSSISPRIRRRIAEQALAVFGGDHVASAAIEQFAAELLLKSLQLLADGRLAQVHALTGAREAAALYHRDEALEQQRIDQRRSHYVSH